VGRYARDHGFEPAVVVGSGFRHQVFRRHGGTPSAFLNVYIDGDGSPYLSRYVVNGDPTPAQPVMLKLMALDPGPATYVGRPCYFGLERSTACNPRLWTLARFSGTVVESLAAVIRSEAARVGATQVRLLGHSGGGALAVLLARRLDAPFVAAVVTLAGNLDHEAWSSLHGYAPLVESLNAICGGPLSGAILQRHYFGEKDEVIPPLLMKKAAEEALGGQWLVVPGMRHTCCWESIWPAVLTGEHSR